MKKKKKKFFTSESVTEGHPDKMCDQISDAVLDEILKKDKNARVACETVVNNGLVLVTGEITTNCYIDIQKIVRETVKEIGYTRAKYGFDYETCGVMTSIEEQSADIALGVNQALESKENGKVIQLGAGDQGMMFGYACNETSTYMPMPIHYAHLLAKRLSVVRKNKVINYLRPDGKSQVTIEYDGNVPKRVDTVVVSSQHKSGIKHEKIKKDIIKNVIKEVIPKDLLDENTKYYINPTGSFVIGGPKADSGLTGRKIIVDTYGGYARHGGGAFSGKDPTKVDRSAAYAARYVAKNLVAANLADKLEVQLAYAIGVAHPVSVDIDTFGTEKIKKEKIIEIINEIFDLRPSSIIASLNLKNPIYKQLAAYGHFGREDLELSWERLDKVEEIKKSAGL